MLTLEADSIVAEITSPATMLEGEVIEKVQFVGLPLIRGVAVVLETERVVSSMLLVSVTSPEVDCSIMKVSLE